MIGVHWRSKKARRSSCLETDLNLASRMKLTGIHQHWVADITCILLKA
jgi:hypothetical protein